MVIVSAGRLKGSEGKVPKHFLAADREKTKFLCFPPTPLVGGLEWPVCVSSAASYNSPSFSFENSKLGFWGTCLCLGVKQIMGSSHSVIWLWVMNFLNLLNCMPSPWIRTLGYVVEDVTHFLPLIDFVSNLPMLNHHILEPHPEIWCGCASHNIKYKGCQLDFSVPLIQTHAYIVKIIFLAINY